jgi:hypothetical protein
MKEKKTNQFTLVTISEIILKNCRYENGNFRIEMIALNKTNSPPVIPSVAETHHFYAAAAKGKFKNAEHIRVGANFLLIIYDWNCYKCGR